MIVMAALGFALRFRDLAISSFDSEESTYADSEALLIPLLALVPVSYVHPLFGLYATFDWQKKYPDWYPSFEPTLVPHIDSGHLQRRRFLNGVSSRQVDNNILGKLFCPVPAGLMFSHIQMGKCQ